MEQEKQTQPLESNEESAGGKDPYTSLSNLFPPSNVQLRRLILRLPIESIKLEDRYRRLSQQPQRGHFIKRIISAKQSMQERFDIIRETIESRKQTGSGSNEQIIKECQTLQIKNIARKYSEYKARENLQKMQQKIKLQRVHRCRSALWLNKTKLFGSSPTRPRRNTHCKKHQEFEVDVMKQVANLQQRYEKGQDLTGCQKPDKENLKLSLNKIKEQNETMSRRHKDQNYFKTKQVLEDSFKRLQELPTEDNLHRTKSSYFSRNKTMSNWAY